MRFPGAVVLLSRAGRMVAYSRAGGNAAGGLGDDGDIALICPMRQVNFAKYEVRCSRHRLLCMGLFSRFWLAVPENARTASAIHLQRGNKSFLRDVDLA